MEIMEMKAIIEGEFGIRVQDISVLGQGMDSVAYRVNEAYIFKQSKHEEARRNLRKEVQVCQYLKGKMTLRIPDIEYYSERYGICGYQEIKGEQLTPDLYQKMCGEEKEQLARDIALFLREIHAVPPPDIDGLELDVMEGYQRDYAALRELIYDKIPEKSQKYLEDLYKRLRSDKRITQTVRALCHRDLSCNHIIMQNQKAVGVIDFGDAAVTDRDQDFVYLLEDSSEEIGREFGVKVLEYYRHPDMAVPIWKADLNEEYYPIEQILGGQAKEIHNMYAEGLDKIVHIGLSV